MKITKPHQRDLMAAEYVLGTQSARVRARFARLLRSDADLASRVDAWQERLLPLAYKVQPVAPPASVWNGIEHRLGFRRQPVAASASWWESLAFWRAMSAVASASTVALALLLVLRPALPPGAPNVMVSLHGEVQGGNSVPRVVIVDRKNTRELVVNTVRPWRDPNAPPSVLELWVIADGKPRSLGVIANGGESILALPESHRQLVMARGSRLAVSMEPPGGSPTGLPTGKVVCAGEIVVLPPKQDQRI